MKTSALFLMLFSALPLLCFAANETRVDSILASVNGDPVSLLDVVRESGRAEARLAAIFSNKERRAETEKLRRTILDEIIARKLIREDFKEKSFEIPEFKQYVESALDSLCSDFGDGSREGLIKKAKTTGVTLDELREQAKKKVIVEIMINEYCNNLIYITPKEVYEYYQKHKEEFSSPPRVELEMIFLKKDGQHKDELSKIIDEIKEDSKSGNGKIFRSLAVLHSEGPNASEGGYLGWIDNSKLRPEFAKALEGAKAGQVAGPIKTDEGFYFLRLVAKKDIIASTFDSVENSIRDKIRANLRIKAYKDYIARLRKAAIIRYYFDLNP